MSYNILYGAGVDRQWDENLPANLRNKNRLPELLSVLEAANPDILGIQEAAGWDRGTPSVAQRVAEELGMNYFLAKTPSENNVALLTKFEIIEMENLSAEVGNVGALRATLLTPERQRVNVFVVHLDPHSSNTRLCEVDVLIQQMQPYFHQMTFLVGDMNFTTYSQESKRLQQAGWELVEWQAHWTIDQIWISPSVKWSQTSWFQLPFPKVWNVSDHLPVSTSISIYPTFADVPPITPIPPTPTTVPPSIVLFHITNLDFLRSPASSRVDACGSKTAPKG